MTTTNYGIPSETELENLAGSLFPDFEPEVCASGLEGLAAGDTSILNYAASKAASYGGGVNYASSAENAFSGYGSISEFEQIANEYNGGGGGYAPVVLSALPKWALYLVLHWCSVPVQVTQ